jgi:hypothetical protein
LSKADALHLTPDVGGRFPMRTKSLIKLKLKEK